MVVSTKSATLLRRLVFTRRIRIPDCIHYRFNLVMAHIGTAEQRTITQQYGDWYTGR